MVEKTIIFGGSFDPIHIGHLHAAEQMCLDLGYKRVLFLPNAANPLKQPARASSADRMSMVELAIEDNPHFQVSTIEMQQEKPGFTIESVRILYRSKEIGKDAVLLIGDDLLKDMHRWNHIHDLRKLVRIVVVSRHQTPSDSSVEYRSVFILPLSSTEIRRRIGNRESFRYLVPEPVFHYIQQRGLYRTWKD